MLPFSLYEMSLHLQCPVALPRLRLLLSAALEFFSLCSVTIFDSPFPLIFVLISLSFRFPPSQHPPQVSFFPSIFNLSISYLLPVSLFATLDSPLVWTDGRGQLFRLTISLFCSTTFFFAELMMSSGDTFWR